MNTHRLAPVVALALTLCSVQPVAAQTHWKWTSAIGYGALGAGLGFLTLGDNWYALDARVLAGGAAGILVGWTLGAVAQTKVRNGVSLPWWHKTSIRLGTVLAGATMGGITSAFIIAPSGSSRLGSDEAIFATAVSIGAAAGALLQLVTDGRFEPRSNQDP